MFSLGATARACHVPVMCRIDATTLLSTWPFVSLSVGACLEMSSRFETSPELVLVGSRTAVSRHGKASLDRSVCDDAYMQRFAVEVVEAIKSAEKVVKVVGETKVPRRVRATCVLCNAWL